MPMTKYVTVTPAVEGVMDAKLLERAEENNILSKFADPKPLDKNNTQTMYFRKYARINPATTPLTEGVTPGATQLSSSDVSAQILQYGDWVQLSDTMIDTHPDGNVISDDTLDNLGESSGRTFDILTAGVLVACNNVIYANGTARTDVNTPISYSMVQATLRLLERNRAHMIKEMIVATDKISTEPISPAYIAVCHSDLRSDLEAMVDSNGNKAWTDVKNYSSQMGLIPGEAGASGHIRFVFDNDVSPYSLTTFQDAGGAKAGSGTTMVSTTGTSADVYPILVFGKRAYGLIKLKGGDIKTYVNMPKSQVGDELAQKASIGWKGWHAAVILQEDWIVRLEVACTSL